MNAAKPLCIYHANCADGFGAAWVVRKFYGADRVDFHAGTYGEAPPDVSGREVVIVDFSYKRPVLMQMAESAKCVLVLDHHKSAAEDLAGLPIPPHGHPDHPELGGWMPDSGIAALFDMERSGAGLAWDYYFPSVPRPALIDHLEDRDLWRFALPGTREIQAAVFSYPYDFNVWDELAAMAPLGLRSDGRAIERKHLKDVAELVSIMMRPLRIGGYIVPAANIPYTMASDAGHLMCEPFDDGIHGSVIPPFAACYWDTPKGRVFSLRSRAPDGADVSAIARKYGGGGHKHAAGFTAPLNKFDEFLPWRTKTEGQQP